MLLLGFELGATIYIGTGSGSTKQEAKQNALRDISSQIFVQIDSTIVHKKQLENGIYSKDVESKSIQKTKANLSGYSLVSLELEDGVYFAKLSYENIPSIDKFINKLPKDIVSTKEYSYLHKTPLGVVLKNQLGFSIDFSIFRKNHHWYIKYQNVTQILDSTDFSKLFSTQQSADIFMSINKKSNFLYEDDEFYFNVKTKKSGFISILSVYEDGTVSILMKNIPVKKETIEKVPDKDFEEIPIAGLIHKGVETYDLYVAVYSEEELYLDSFTQANDSLVTDEKYKNFDLLLDYIATRKYTTLKVITKPRNLF